jgi:hypothetical protein
MSKLFTAIALSLFVISPLHASLIVTSGWAHAEIGLAFEEPPSSLDPTQYDDVTFNDNYTGGLDFDIFLNEEGDYKGQNSNYHYSGYTRARGTAGLAAPDLSGGSYNAVFGALLCTDDEGYREMHAYTTSLIDAVIHFTMVDSDASGYMSGFIEHSLSEGPWMQQSYTLYDLTAGTSVSSPQASGLVHQVSLLEGHNYALSYHSFRSFVDATSQFTFFTDTDVIFAKVPTPSALLLLASGLMGLLLARKSSAT